jgi:hypothetical protein
MHCIGELIEAIARCPGRRYCASLARRACATAFIIMSEPIAMTRSTSANGISIGPSRPQDHAFVGNIVEAIEAYGSGRLGPIEIPLADIDRIIAIGSDMMMNAVAQARHAKLAAYFRPGHRAIASINSPMQCMMKEICAQCLQRHRDPVTGTETVVFSCFNQDQEMDRVDFRTLRRRLSQNGVQEKLTKLWVDRCLQHLGERPAIAAE